MGGHSRRFEDAVLELAGPRVCFVPTASGDPDAALVRFYETHGITVERVLSDNGTCFKRRWADACAARAITVKKTRAYRPQTNGKACVSRSGCRPVGRRGCPLPPV